MDKLKRVIDKNAKSNSSPMGELCRWVKENIDLTSYSDAQQVFDILMMKHIPLGVIFQLKSAYARTKNK